MLSKANLPPAHRSNNGVSLIILTLNAARHLDKLLNTFFATNTHQPVELIIVDHASTDQTAEIVAKHESNGDVRYIRRLQNNTFSESCNFGAEKAKHPHLLFLNNDIIYTADSLPMALATLEENLEIGAVGIRLDDDPASLPKGMQQGIQHIGIHFVWNEERGYYQPEQLRYPNLKQYLSSLSHSSPPTFHPAVTAAFLLVRKSDFRTLNGFNKVYDYGLEDIDFCLRLWRDLKKKCLCINEIGLQHVDGATRFAGNKQERSRKIEGNHRFFRARWGNYIRHLIGQPASPTKVHVASKSLRPDQSTTYSVKQQTVLLGEARDFIRTNKPQVREKLHGAILPNHKYETILRGWLASKGDHESRTALVKIDHQHSYEVHCNMFRNDLKKKGVNSGWHGFEFIVPLHLADGKPHQITLTDKQTQQVVAKGHQTWHIKRTFKDFSGFLTHSSTMPTLLAPFREEDKRCFAVMENIADTLVSVSEQCEKMPKVSVIMPVYNRARIVQTAIESALNQSYHNIELIVVDDGSTDGTADILNGVNDQRMVVVHNDRNMGQCYSLNRAITAAQGEYIAYLDSDNTWDTRYLAAMVGAFEILTDAEALYSGQFLYRGDVEKPFAMRYGALNKSLLVNRNYVDRNAFMHKKNVHERLGGYDEGISRYVDWDFIIRTSEACTMYSIPVALSRYYYDRTEDTMTNNDQHLGDLEIIRERCKARFEEHCSGYQRPDAAPQRKVSVIIPSYESLSDLRECLDALFALHIQDWVEIIVVDNASSPPVVEYLKDLDQQELIVLIDNDANYGFSHAVNQGLAVSWPGRDILLLNNDAVLTPGAIEAMQTAVHELSDCAVVVPQQVLPGQTKTIDEHVPYANPKFACDVNVSAHHVNVVNAPVFHNGEVLELTYAPFFCAYIKREVMDRVGGLDMVHGRHYRSDRIFCDFVRHVLNMRIYHISEAVVHHKLQKSTDALRQSPAHKACFDMLFCKNQWEPVLAKRLGCSAPVWDF